MKQITEYLNEAVEPTVWVAIEVTTKDSLDRDKTHTSQRVVSYDTYREMKEKGQTKGYMQIVSLDIISPKCKTKDQAMEYVEQPKREMRKTAIDKKGADYIVYAINIGKFAANGNTKFDWNFWDNVAEFADKGEGTEIYVGKWGMDFLFGAKGSLKVGDKICVVDNDTQKKLTGAPSEVGAAILVKTKEDFVEAYRKAFPDRCKKPSRQFGKVSDGLPWTRFGQMYSIKGVSE